MTIRNAAWPLLIAAIPVVLLAPGLMVGPSLDAAVFSVVGLEMAHGALPYEEVWDHKPPVAYLINAIGHLLGSPERSWWFVWTVTALSTSLAAVVITRTIRIAGMARWEARIAGVMVAAAGGSYFLALGGGMTESLALLPLALATFLVAGTRPRRPQQHLLSGLFLGVALAIAPQAAAAGCGLLVLSARASVRRWAGPAWLIAGGATIAVIVLTALVALGVLGAAIDALLQYSTAYRRLGTGSLALVPWVMLALLPIVTLAAVGTVGLRRVRVPAVSALGHGALAWILAWLLLTALQGRLYGHYIITVLPPLAYLAAIGVKDLSHAFTIRPTLRVIAAAAGVATISIALLAGWAAAQYSLFPTQRVNATATEVGHYLRGLASPGDGLLVWGNEPSLYLASGLRPSSRFVYFFPLSTPGYATDALIASVAEDMDERPPRFVVDAGSRGPGEPGYLPLLMERGVLTDGRSLDLLDPLRDIVAERYRLADIVQGWPVYVLRENVASQ